MAKIDSIGFVGLEMSIRTVILKKCMQKIVELKHFGALMCLNWTGPSKRSSRDVIKLRDGECVVLVNPLSYTSLLFHHKMLCLWTLHKCILKEWSRWLALKQERRKKTLLRRFQELLFWTLGLPNCCRICTVRGRDRREVFCSSNFGIRS